MLRESIVEATVAIGSFNEHVMTVVVISADTGYFLAVRGAFSLVDRMTSIFLEHRCDVDIIAADEMGGDRVVDRVT